MDLLLERSSERDRLLQTTLGTVGLNRIRPHISTIFQVP